MFWLVFGRKSFRNQHQPPKKKTDFPGHTEYTQPILWQMDVSENSRAPKSSTLIGVFHHKPSILRYHYFWKHLDLSWNLYVFQNFPFDKPWSTETTSAFGAILVKGKIAALKKNSGKKWTSWWMRRTPLPKALYQPLLPAGRRTGWFRQTVGCGWGSYRYPKGLGGSEISPESCRVAIFEFPGCKRFLR